MGCVKTSEFESPEKFCEIHYIVRWPLSDVYFIQAYTTFRVLPVRLYSTPEIHAASDKVYSNISIIQQTQLRLMVLYFSLFFIINGIMFHSVLIIHRWIIADVLWPGRFWVSILTCASSEINSVFASNCTVCYLDAKCGRQSSYLLSTDTWDQNKLSNTSHDCSLHFLVGM
jgi:hypothetical protein